VEHRNAGTDEHCRVAEANIGIKAGPEVYRSNEDHKADVTLRLTFHSEYSTRSVSMVHLELLSDAIAALAHTRPMLFRQSQLEGIVAVAEKWIPPAPLSSEGITRESENALQRTDRARPLYGWPTVRSEQEGACFTSCSGAPGARRRFSPGR